MFVSRYATNVIARQRIASRLGQLQLPAAKQQQQQQWVTTASRHRSPYRKRVLEEQAEAKRKMEGGKERMILEKNKHKIYGIRATALVALGVALYGLVFLNQYLANRERDNIEKQYNEIYAEFGDPDRLGERKYKDDKALFPCIVRLRSRVFSELGPLKVGDVVDILVEGVGKDKSLNICRTRPQNPEEKPTICLFPMACLQRIELEE